jgi:hypothetical protein
MPNLTRHLSTIASISVAYSLTSFVSSAQTEVAQIPPARPVEANPPSAPVATSTQATATTTPPIVASPPQEPSPATGRPLVESNDPAPAPAGPDAAGAAIAPTPPIEQTAADHESGAVEPPAEEVPAEPIHDHVKLGGGAILYYYQPTKEGRGNVSVFFANLLLDAQWKSFGLHIEPRFRDTKLRPFFDGPAWLQEAYASFSLSPVTVKVGKAYKRSPGLFWDNSFFGNVQVYDGLKLDPNYGVSVEGSIGEKFGLDFAAQYFVVDGLTNVSLQGRDTFSTPGARRRHTKAARLEPWLKLGAAVELRAGGLD